MTEDKAMPDTQDTSQSTPLLSIINQVLGSSQVASTPQDSPDEPAAKQVPSSSGGDVLSSLLSNPELLSKLPQIIAMARPLLDMLSKGSSPQIQASIQGDPANTDKSSTETVAAGKFGSGGDRQDSRISLLCAMKPYLKRERCEAIDKMLGLVRLGDILKTL